MTWGRSPAGRETQDGEGDRQGDSRMCQRAGANPGEVEVDWPWRFLFFSGFLPWLQCLVRLNCRDESFFHELLSLGKPSTVWLRKNRASCSARRFWFVIHTIVSTNFAAIWFDTRCWHFVPAAAWMEFHSSPPRDNLNLSLNLFVVIVVLFWIPWSCFAETAVTTAFLI